MGHPPQPTHPILDWLPDLRREIWILAAGQLLLFIGQGFTLVYASIYFVNQLGFSPTQVGVALSSAGITGMVGRFFSGTAIDSEWLGRRRTLLMAAVISALSCFSLAFATTFWLLVLGNLLMGLGLSLYWPATLAVTADLTTSENRAEAFALTQLSNNLGVGLGALLAGQYMALSGNFQVLFVIKGLTYLVFGGVIYIAISETSQTPHTSLRTLAGNWLQALRDSRFTIFLVANIFFAIYGAQISSTLPLYLANFVPGGNTQTGFSEQMISYFFFWHALLKIVLQLPITRRVQLLNHVTPLLIALILWTGGFFMIWLTGVVPVYAVIPALLAFSLIALTEILYAPSAIALVGDLSPVDLRGIYFALESECWAIGFLIGPALGGWALDHPAQMGTNIWLVLISSTAVAGAILISLRQQIMVSGAIGIESLDNRSQRESEIVK
jgi:MFS family permease